MSVQVVPYPSNLQPRHGTTRPQQSSTKRREQWADVVSIVNLAVRGAVPTSPAFDPAHPELYRRHWSAVFADLHACVATDASVSTQLASPPVTRFTITLVDDGGRPGDLCPCCCLPSGLRPSIVLHNERGVTKGDLIGGLAELLFGDQALPLFYATSGDSGVGREHADKGSEIRGHRGAVLPYEAGWVSTHSGVWLFCCSPSHFASRIADGSRRMELRL